MEHDQADAPTAANHDEAGAADYLGLKPKTLANWRSRGCGPRYLKLGARVVYPQSELDAFNAANLRRSTAEGSR